MLVVVCDRVPLTNSSQACKAALIDATKFVYVETEPWNKAIIVCPLVHQRIHVPVTYVLM